MRAMDEGKAIWKNWCAKRAVPVFIGFCLLFPCVCGLLFFQYQRKLTEQKMELVGALYLQDEETARTVLNQMMAGDLGGNIGRKTEQAALLAAETFGYERDSFLMLDRRAGILFCGQVLGLMLLFFAACAGLWHYRSRKILADTERLHACLLDGRRKMKAMAVPGEGQETALAEFEDILRRESMGFAEGVSRMLGSAVADGVKQYRILWENQTGLRLQMKTFTENIAHQLKTPLARMMLALDMMEPGNMVEKREGCIRELEQMKPLVEGILNISRMESGKVVLASKPVDLLLLLQDAIRKTGQREPYRWEFQGNDREEIIIYGDEVWLTQAFLNLYENAARYSPLGGTIRTEIVRAAGGLQLEISDEGGGIPEEALQAMFERFFSADSQDVTRTGIGLNLARAVVEKHHGRLQVHNEGRGAVFSVFLPVYPLKDSVLE